MFYRPTDRSRSHHPVDHRHDERRAHHPDLTKLRGWKAMQAEADLAEWASSGQLKVIEDIVDGLESAPSALIGLLGGKNRGKRMVRVAADG